MGMTWGQAACKVAEWCKNIPWVTPAQLDDAIAGIVDEDDQQLSLNGNILTLEDGGTVDLSPFLDDTDDQQITDFSLTGTILTITLEDGGTDDVDLAGLIPVEEEIIEITCAQARTLGNAGALIPGQHYLVTDYNRGTVGAAQILTHAVTINNLSWDVAVQTAFDDSAWHGRWDPDTCRIVDLYDNLGNNIKSDNGDEVERFPWGNPLVTGNEFNDTGFVYTAGAVVRDNVGHPTAYLQIAGGTITGSVLGPSADVRMSDTAQVNRTEIGEARLTVSGTGRFDDSIIDTDSYAITDAVEIRNATLSNASLLYATGGTGRLDRVNADRGYIDVRNAADIDIDDLDLSAYGQVRANGAQRIRLQYVEITTSAYVQATAAATELLVINTEITSASLIQATAGTLEVRNSDLTSISRIQHSSTGANRVDNTSLDSYGRVFFQNSADANRILYSHVDSLGMLRFRGTTSGGLIGRCRASAQGYIDLVNDTGAIVRYTTVDTLGYLILNGGTGVSVNYSSFNGYGRMLIEQGSTGRVLGVTLNGTAYARLRNHASDFRYSTLTSYFYYYLTGNTAVKQGLHGEGRQTYTEPNPTAVVTGPGQRNW